MSATLRLGPSQIADAAAILAGGGLVALPTETVYGLGADATNSAAVARVFEAKGRPSGHPLIVHLASADAIAAWSASADPRIDRLAATHWPGPLTLIVAATDRVADEVVGGRSTVGLRVPDHELTQAVIAALGPDAGVAAPSANRFGHISPTTADHVLADLDGRIDAVLDGGPCAVGVESTIVELGEGPPVLLRPGGVAVADIEATLGEVVIDGRSGESRAAGMMASHYAPDATVELVDNARQVAAAIDRVAATDRVTATDRVAAPSVIVVGPTGPGERPSSVEWIELPADAAGFAQGLYRALRDADAQRPDRIIVVPPTGGHLLPAVLDRLAKAAAEPDPLR